MAPKQLARRTFLAGTAAAASLATLGGLKTAVAEDKYELKIATVAPDRTPWADLLKSYKKTIEVASKGRIKVRVFLGGTMGDENETVRMTARGQLSGVGASTGAVASLVEELAAIEIPFQFASANEADYVLDKFLMVPMEEKFRAKGLVLGFWSENGFRHFGASFPVHKPGDLKNKKMRSQESYVHIEMWKQLQAAAQAIPQGATKEMVAKGNEIYHKQGLCYACHGQDAKGLVGPNLTDDYWMYGDSREAMRDGIANGHHGVMPAHRALLGETRARLAAAYVWSLSHGSTAAPGNAR